MGETLSANIDEHLPSLTGGEGMMMGTMDVMPLSTSEVEVMAKPTRRRYSAEYKLRILREADASTRRGEIDT